MDELRREIDEKRAELSRLETKWFDLDYKKRSMKRLEHAVFSSFPPVTRIEMGGIVIHLNRDSQWTSTVVERVNEETGKKYTRYQTVVEADPEKAYSFKRGHYVFGRSTAVSDLPEWIMFETDAPLIKHSAAFITMGKEEWPWFDNSKSAEVNVVKTPPILLFATKMEERLCGWEKYPFPELTLFRHDRLGSME